MTDPAVNTRVIVIVPSTPYCRVNCLSVVVEAKLDVVVFLI